MASSSQFIDNIPPSAWWETLNPGAFLLNFSLPFLSRTYKLALHIIFI